MCGGVALSSCSQDAIAKVGVCDLRGASFAPGSQYSLMGQWEFLPCVVSPVVGKNGDAGKGDATGKVADSSAARYSLRFVPDQWSGSVAGWPDGKGAGLYRLRVLLPKNHPPLAIRMPTTAVSYSLYCDGHPVAKAGRVALNPAAAVAGYAPDAIALPSVGDEALIEIAVSNYVYRVGGLWHAPSLACASWLVPWQDAVSLWSLYLSAALGMVALCFLLLFAFRRKEWAFFWMALFCLDISLRTVVTGEYAFTQLFPGASFDLIIRLEYATAYLGLPLALGLFSSIIHDYVRKWEKYLLSIPSLLFMLSVLFFPLDLMTRTIKFYYPIIMLSLAWGVYRVVVSWLIPRKVGYFGIVVGMLVLALATVNDMLYSAFFVRTINLLPYGLVFFAIALTGVLAHRFAESYKAVEDSLEQKELLVKEVHHRVKNSLQVVASLITLQANKQEDPDAAEGLRDLRKRILSIALVHEQLYGKTTEDNLDLEAYLVQLAQRISGEMKIAVEGPGEAFEVPVDSCVDIGLIVTELITNAVKYAAPPEGGSLARVRLALEGEDLLIDVEDSGPGLPSGFKPEESPGLGYRIILSLIKKMRGTISFSAGQGCVVRIRIPPLKAKRAGGL
jgi:two-component sensor histidine kinase